MAIHKLPEFVIVKELCNHSKHMGNTPYRLEATYGALISEYSNIGSVFSIASGPPIGYSVDRRDLFDIIEVALAFYQSEWYEKLQK